MLPRFALKADFAARKEKKKWDKKWWGPRTPAGQNPCWLPRRNLFFGIRIDKLMLWVCGSLDRVCVSSAQSTLRGVLLCATASTMFLRGRRTASRRREEQMSGTSTVPPPPRNPRLLRPSRYCVYTALGAPRARGVGPGARAGRLLFLFVWRLVTRRNCFMPGPATAAVWEMARPYKRT
jgi:hypothetical protein